MSVRDDLRKRAVESTVAAALRAGRQPVVDMLKRFGAQRASDVQFSSLPEYIDDIEALKAQPPKVPVEFKIGERVRPTGNYSSPGTVVGYEVRYIVQKDGAETSPVWGYRAEKLQSIEISAPAAPSVPWYSKPANQTDTQWSDEQIKTALRARTHFYFQVRDNY